MSVLSDTNQGIWVLFLLSVLFAHTAQSWSLGIVPHFEEQTEILRYVFVLKGKNTVFIWFVFPMSYTSVSPAISGTYWITI